MSDLPVAKHMTAACKNNYKFDKKLIKHLDSHCTKNNLGIEKAK